MAHCAGRNNQQVFRKPDKDEGMHVTEKNGQSKDLVFRAMWNNMLPILREQGGEIFGRVTQAAATNFVGEDAAKQAGKAVNSTFQVGLTVSANVRDFSVVAKESRRNMGQLLDDVEPFLIEEFGKSSRGKLMRSANEVVAHERDCLMGKTKYGFFKATSGLMDKLPEAVKFMDKKREEVGDGELSAAAEGDMRAKLDEGLGKVAQSGIFDEQNRKMLDAAIRTGVPAIQEYIEAEGAERFSQVSAFALIKDLAEQAKSGEGRIGYVMHPVSAEQMPLEEYIIEVFRQHQVDMGGAPLNERFRFMPEMEAAAKQIATEIEDNLLDPMALVSLVGKRTVLDENLRVSTPEKVEEALKTAWRVIEKGQHVDSEEFIAETAFATKEDFRAILEGLPEEEKTFFASLFPDDVLKDLGGMKTQEIDAIKEQGGEQFVEQMTRAIETLGTLGEKELQRYGLTAKEGQLMRELSDAIDELGAETVVQQLQGRAREEVAEAVRNGRGYWQERVQQGVRGQEMAEAPEALTEDKAQAAEAEIEPVSAPEAESFTEKLSRRPASTERGI